MPQKIPSRLAANLQKQKRFSHFLELLYSVGKRRSVVDRQGRVSGFIVKPVTISRFLNSVGINPTRTRSPLFNFLFSFPKEFREVADIRMHQLFALWIGQTHGIDMCSRDYLLATARHIVPVGRLPHESEARGGLRKKIGIPADRSALLRNGRKWDAYLSQRLASLKRHGSLFVKPIETGTAIGVYKLSLGKRALTISTHEEVFRQMLLEHFPKATSKGNSVQIPFSGSEAELREIVGKVDLVVFPSFMKKTQDSPEVSTSKDRTIKPPLVNGKVWELRLMNFRQGLAKTDSRLRQLHYAKIGTDSLIASISKGGTGADSIKTVQSAYKTLFPKISDQASLKLAKEFVEKMEHEGRKVLWYVEKQHNKAKKMFGKDFPMDYLPVSSLSTDFMAEFNPKTNRLEPVLTDIGFGFGWLGTWEMKDFRFDVGRSLKAREIDLWQQLLEKQIKRESRKR